MKHRSSPLIILAIATGLTISACSGNSGSSNSASAGDPVSGGTLTVGINDVPQCIDAALTPYNNFVGRSVVDNLVEQNLQTGAVEPWLAKSWETSQDGRAYTFHLREDVTFSNGEKFDAAAVKANLDNAIEFRKKDGRGVAAGYIAGYKQSTVVDEHTVTIEFDSPKAGFLQALSEKALGIAWPGSLGGTYDQRCTAGVIGTGPFVVAENVPDDHITITKRAGYNWASPNAQHNGDAYLDSVKFVEIPESGIQAESLLSGELDASVSLSSNDIDRVVAAGNTIESRVSAGIPDTLYPNLERAPFNDLAVRQAFQVGFNREEINATVYNKYSPHATSVVSTPVPGYVNLGDSLAYDPDRANRILDEAGWAKGSDGIRVKNGARLTGTQPFTSGNDKPALQLLQAQLKKIGFDLQIEQVTTAENTERLKSGNYDLFKGNFTRADPDALLNTYHPDFVNYGRYTHTNVPDLVKLLDAQTAELDTTRRHEIFAEAQKLIIDKGYGFPFNESGRSTVTTNSVHGITYTLPGWAQFYDTWKS